MLVEAFNKFYTERQTPALTIESTEGIVKHLTHLEELILTQKKQGLDSALFFIDELKNEFSGNSTGKIFTTVKYDGAPAVIAGYNPENNKFFVSTKGIANVNPKINYTDQDIETNHGHAPGLVNKLKLGLRYLPAVIRQGIYQGDFMFDHSDLKAIDYEGEQLLTFKPNTITYAVPADSNLGRKINSSKIGIVFHTKYSGDTLTSLTKSSDVNVSEFTPTADVWFDDAKFKDVSGVVTFTQEESSYVDSLIEDVRVKGDKIKWEALPDVFYTLVNTYINTLIREGKFVEDSSQSFDGFKEWFDKRITNEINKLKTESGKEKKIQAKNEIIGNFNANRENILNIFDVTKEINDIKKIFINKYNSAIRTKQFISEPDGSLKVTAPEGYVAVDHLGNMIKLVDRLEFSKANFAVTKGDKFK
jgi:hypothetical protein